MSAGSKGKWFIDEHAYRRWAHGKESALGPDLSLSRATVRNAVCLALIENSGRYVSYDDLNRCFRMREFVTNSPEGQGKVTAIPTPTLRVAVSELTKALARKEHYLEIRSQRVGKTSQFSLSDRHRAAEKEHGLLHGVNEPLIDPKDITRGLVRDGGALPFASLYAAYRAASQWLCFSSVTSTEKRVYEAGAFDGYRLEKKFGLRGYGGEMGYISLGTGEGLGEVALLNRLLRDHDKPRPRKIHYVAIDTSEFLLSSHSHLVRERFEKELSEGRLVYVPIVGDLFQLQRCLSQVRYKMGEDFLKDLPILCTYFGNCLGNYENHEWDFFRSVVQGVPTQPLSILVGVSLMRRQGDSRAGSPIEENYTLDPFLLETPRHLMYDLELLRSEDSRGRAISLASNREFLADPADQEKIPSLPYHTAAGVEGRVYRFYYKLLNDLVTWDGQQRMKRGNKILLYSIIKYDLRTLVDFLKQRNFTVSSPPNEYKTWKITDGAETFEYAVIAANRVGQS